jgi:predicted ATP-binding protein involved in virulence
MESYCEKLLLAAEEADKLDKCFKSILQHMTDAVGDVENVEEERKAMTKRYERERDTRYIATIIAFLALYIGFFIGRYISPK